MCDIVLKGPERILKYDISDMSGYMIWIYKKEWKAAVRFCSGLTNICLRCYHDGISNKVSAFLRRGCYG